MSGDAPPRKYDRKLPDSHPAHRIDRRTLAQLRDLEIEPGFTSTPLGSVLIATGKTRVLCTASLEPRTPSWLESGGWITAEYAMLPGATNPRGRRDPGGRGKEIQRLIGRSLRAAVELGDLVDADGGRGLSFVCDCDVIEADGGTRTAAITGAWVALEIALRKLVAGGRLAAHPGLGPVAAVSVGIVESEQEDREARAMLDLCYHEDSRAMVDLNVVMCAGRRGSLSPDGRPGLIEVQGTGERGDFSRAQLDRMLDLAEAGIVELMAAQQVALAAAGA